MAVPEPASLIAKNNDFEPHELLFRAVAPENWNFATNEVLLAAIDLPQTSVDRSLYGSPEKLRSRDSKKSHWGVAHVSVGELPSEVLPYEHANPNVLPYYWSLDHDPEINNPAHTHIFTKNARGVMGKPGDSRMKSTIREALRKTFKPTLAPTAPDPHP